MDGSGRGKGAPEAAKAIVLYDTRYGNTERVAKALARGIELAGVKAECSHIADVDHHHLSEFDFVAIGGPTHYRTASQPMQDFLSSLRGLDLSGKAGFAFDTRKESFWAGSAAKYIERSLQSKGMKMIWPTTSAWVYVPAGTGEEDSSLSREELKERQRSQVKLGEKMEELFERTGSEIGKSLASST
jgi:flavorubredoxin